MRFDINDAVGDGSTGMMVMMMVMVMVMVMLMMMMMVMMMMIMMMMTPLNPNRVSRHGIAAAAAAPASPFFKRNRRMSRQRIEEKGRGRRRPRRFHTCTTTIYTPTP